MDQFCDPLPNIKIEDTISMKSASRLFSMLLLTAPLLLTVGRSNVVNTRPFRGPQDSLPQMIYALIRLPIKAEVQRAWTAALVLIAIILVLFVVARLIGGRGPGHIGRLQRRRLVKKGLLQP